ncbi:sensor histidine kinase CpxA [Abditibacteriota bacterium]|nr:sensor histidine kinase CpxA [Abditibacteriota bacterium]
MNRKSYLFMSLFWKIFGWFWVAQIMIISATVTYFTMRGPDPTPRHGPPTFWSFFSQQVGILFGIGALVSYALARYLASPTIKLRRATHQLAEGDLTVRVGPQMGRRRDELADMGRDFDLMAERIERLVESERRLVESERRIVEAQQRLLADISHELRSPLARIAYALDLAKGSANEETGSYLKRIERESGRLNDLIGQLLTLARLEATPHQEDALAAAAPVDLSKLVSEVCQDADFEARGRDKKVRLIKNEGGIVKGSADLLRSAVENVIRNAIRHTPQGSTVEVTLQHNAQGATITVRDFGPGAPEDSLTDLFRPFYRVDQSREHKSGGVGLGLSITERAVRFHGGAVHAQNATDGGLIVELTLPISTGREVSSA